jgi:glutathione S-transferase
MYTRIDLSVKGFAIKETTIMKLYYTPGACSLSPHIALLELGLDHSLVKVDPRTKKTETGVDFLSINPKGYVPALEIEPGQVLTEGVAIVQYLANKKGESAVFPKFGSLDYFRAVEWLVFISSEIYEGFMRVLPGPNPAGQEKLQKRLTFLGEHLKDHAFLAGEAFSLADGYLFTILRWSDLAKIDLSQFGGLLAYRDRVGARPSAQAAINAEGPSFLDKR